MQTIAEFLNRMAISHLNFQMEGLKTWGSKSKRNVFRWNDIRSYHVERTNAFEDLHWDWIWTKSIKLLLESSITISGANNERELMTREPLDTLRLLMVFA